MGVVKVFMRKELWENVLVRHLSYGGLSWMSACSSLRWPNTIFARALADAIQHVHKDCKNKHAVDTAIIFCAQCPFYLCYISS